MNGRNSKLLVKDISKETFVWLLLLFTVTPFFGYAQTKKEQAMTTSIKISDDEAAIRALEDRFTAAFNAGDIDAIMKNYTDKSFVLFDIVPRKEYLGAEAYRKAWIEMFSRFKGKPKIVITGLSIIVDGNVGYGHCFMRVTGTDIQGHSIDRMVRVTDGYRKIGGNWLIAHEHISVPVDFTTGKLVPIPH
jgi:ketosteroid isomerase-like protein